MKTHNIFSGCTAFLLIMALIISCGGCRQGKLSQESSSQTLSQGESDMNQTTFNNKLAENGNDPWVILKDGIYYYCYSGDGGVWVAKSDSISEVGSSGGVRVWTPEDENYSKEIWAPELHYLEGKWYIYVAADDGDNFNHRMLCLEGTSDDPTEPFIFKSVMRAKTDRWAIDGTAMEYGGQLYFIWSGWQGSQNVDQRLYIARLENPWTIDGERTEISFPLFNWECKGGTPHINEGPTALELNGQMHIIYSASGSWSDEYCLGMLTLNGDDPLNPDSWTKSKEPVFSKTDKIFGPGHASFTTSKDGSQHFIFYHANEESGSGWGGRKLWAQEFTLDENNHPVFGSPLPAGSMQTVNSDR